MTPFAAVDIAPIVEWLDAIPLEAWPQQTLDGLRPAMMTDPGWHDFGDVVAPVIAKLMRHFPGCISFQQMLSVVMPGHRIEPHRDSQAPYWLCRVHVPLTSNPGAWFFVEGVAHHLAPGFAYKINTKLDHAVVNHGRTPRTHLMFDVRDA